MIFFITVLKALATCLITNAHFTGVYPSDLIANGGLIGDILFFAISGYCLYNIKDNFIKWYWRRVYRVYIPVIMGTFIFLMIGVYTLTDHTMVWWYIYPTYYHFVASIIVLYIPYYFIIRNDFLKNHLKELCICIAVLGFAIYCLFYDNTYYHIDTVREPMIRFLFMESMLLGAYFKQNDALYRNNILKSHMVGAISFFVLYFVSKLLFSKYPVIAQFQIINQLLIFILLYFLFIVFCGLDGKLSSMPNKLKNIIRFLSNLTLEIYIVQYAIIDVIRPLFGFPINWIMLVVMIVFSAWLLNRICYFMYHFIDILGKK